MASRRALLALVMAACTAAIAAPKSKCSVTEAQLAGAWVSVSGPSFFEEMAFEYEGGKRVFNSWLHHRPEIFGADWKLDSCRLRVRHENGMTFDFASVRVRGDRLYLREDGKKAEAVYKRIKP